MSPSAPSFSEECRLCRPAEGKVYLTLGQDLFSIQAYLREEYNASLHEYMINQTTNQYILNDNQNKRVRSSQPPHPLDTWPAAFMVYTDLETLAGLNKPTDYGSGVEYANGLAAGDSGADPNVALQIGLWLGGSEGCRAINNHTWSSQVARLVDYLSTREAGNQFARIFVRVGYEFDNPSFGYADDPASYRQAFRSIVQACRTVPACFGRTLFVWHSWAAGVPAPWQLQDFYPGNDVVDWIGVSVFQQVYHLTTAENASIWSGGSMETLETVLQFAQEQGNDKPVMIAESTPFGGIDEGLTDAWNQWFDPVLELIDRHSSQIAMWSYIDCNWNAQQMWHDVGFGDTRVAKNATLHALWREHVVQSKKFLGYRSWTDCCGSDDKQHNKTAWIHRTEEMTTASLTSTASNRNPVEILHNISSPAILLGAILCALAMTLFSFAMLARKGSRVQKRRQRRGRGRRTTALPTAMNVAISLSWLLCASPQVFSFQLQPLVQQGSARMQQRLSLSSTPIDFDYEAPNPGSRIYASPLPSSYPKGMPAGLRGEAVRSALRSGRCVGWSLHNTPLIHGLLRVRGKGTLDFLNNKLSNSFTAPSKGHGTVASCPFREAALLTAKGRIVDRLCVVVASDSTAYVQTSPRHTGQELFRRLDPFVFPLDQVELQAMDVFGFTLASTRQNDVVKMFEEYIRKDLGLADNLSLSENGKDSLAAYNEDGTLRILIIPSISLAQCAAVGHTFWFTNASEGHSIWESLTSDNNHQGPVTVGALEYESLRIQSGWPGYGTEMTGSRERDKEAAVPATPLELHAFEGLVDTNKGCYMGQEGIASVLKNPRGPPRLLYQVAFGDEFNLYDSETAGESTASSVENLTRLPQPGDALFVLGSNQEIAVGVLTSVAEPGSTGDSETLGLALIRRADSILKAMKDRDLEITREFDMSDTDLSGMIQPPPLDPLDGLEVIVENSFTVGILRSVPSRRFVQRGQNMFLREVPDFVRDLPSQEDDFVDITRVSLGDGHATGDLYEKRRVSKPVDKPVVEVEWEQPDDTDVGSNKGDDGDDVSDDDDSGDDNDEEAALEQARLEASAAQAAAEAAAAEAKRKAAKMEMLEKRAQEALARRQAKKQQNEE